MTINVATFRVTSVSRHQDRIHTPTPDDEYKCKYVTDESKCEATFDTGDTRFTLTLPIELAKSVYFGKTVQLVVEEE